MHGPRPSFMEENSAKIPALSLLTNSGERSPIVQDVTCKLSYRLAIDKATRLSDYADCFSDTNENE